MSFPRLSISPAVNDSCMKTQQQPLQLVEKLALCSYRKLIQWCFPRNASCPNKVVISWVTYWIIWVFPFYSTSCVLEGNILLFSSLMCTIITLEPSVGELQSGLSVYSSRPVPQTLQHIFTSNFYKKVALSPPKRWSGSRF